MTEKISVTLGILGTLGISAKERPCCGKIIYRRN
jgi:hypothetical protein